MALGGETFGIGFIGTPVGGLTIGQPTDLHSYQNIGDTIVNYWTLTPFSYAFYSVEWDLQTDLVDTFDSDNLLTYLSSDILAGPNPENYITGCIHRGIVVPIYPRLEGAPRRMYWRVRAIYEGDLGAWTTSYFDIPQSTREATRTSLLSFLPDALYDKSEGYEPSVGSNIFKIHDDYAKEFDNANQQMTLVNNDYYIKSARDSALQPNFGDLLGMQRPDLMQVIDYREILKTFMVNIRTAPNRAAIRNMVAAIYQQDPIFKNIRDVYGQYVYDNGILDAYDYNSGIFDYIMWDNEHLATGIIIEVYNQLNGGAYITPEYVEGIIRNMILTQTPVFVSQV